MSIVLFMRTVDDGQQFHALYLPVHYESQHPENVTNEARASTMTFRGVNRGRGVTPPFVTSTKEFTMGKPKDLFPGCECGRCDAYVAPESRCAGCPTYAKSLLEAGRLVDKLGMHVDVGIRELVAGLRFKDFPTVSSCEGHLDRGRGYPWVDVHPPRPPPLEGMSLKDIPMGSQCGMKAVAAKLQDRATCILQRFYAERRVPYRTMLAASKPWVRGFTIQSLGAHGAFLLKNIPAREAELVIFQQEARDFGLWLGRQAW